tara:strand:+ start:2160 stop:3626 length:1467 start_codon:yes stop_codon:yes gene_type:complete
MTAIEKFTFALSFDDADNVIRSSGGDDEHYEMGKKKKKKKEEEAPPPPPAIYTEEQSAQMIAEAENAAREQALAEGHAQGLEQGRQEILSSLEKASADCQAVIGEKLAQIDEQQKRANAGINEDAIYVALGVMRKLAPAWSKQYELTEIEDIVRQCLANLFEAPKVMIKVHPDLEQTISDSAQQIALSRGFSGNVVVVGEPDVAPGDCMVSWGDGTAVRDSSRVWAEINNIIDTALGLHSEEHDLAESDMGDPDIQETRLPDEAPAANPEHQQASQVPADEEDNEPNPVPNASDQVSASADDSSVTTDLSADDAGEVPLDVAHEVPQNVTSDTSQDSAPSDPSEHQVKEGDGTSLRNVQTSPDDAMPTLDNAPETLIDPVADTTSTEHTEQNHDQAAVTAPTQQDAADLAQNTNEDATPPTNQGDGAAHQTHSPETDGPTKPQSANPTPGASAEQDGNPENGQAPHSPRADDRATVKQSTKDAGDENG